MEANLWRLRVRRGPFPPRVAASCDVWRLRVRRGPFPPRDVVTALAVGHHGAVALPYDDAVAQLTAPGARFETARVDIRGVPTTVFVNGFRTLRELFDGARQRPDDVYLVYEDERWTFGQVMDQVDGIAQTLTERYGVTRGDRVAIAMRNYPEWITSFAAITSVGAISVSMNAWWTSDEMDYALRDSAPKVLIADAERIERARPTLAETGTAAIAVRTESTPVGIDRLADVLPEDPDMPAVEVAPDDDATILYTSGTTGRPKGAVSTHRAVTQALLGFACRGAVERLRSPEGQDDGDEPDAFAPCFILAVPLFHVTGCVPVMLSTFAAGVKLVIMYRWDPARALELIERERVTNFVGVPTMSWDLLECPDFAERDTSSLIAVGGGGAPAPPELVRRVESSFARARPGIGYGMTETNAYGPQNSGDDYVSHPTSTGRATPILEIKVVDANGTDLPPGELGEICFKGPNLIRGYWNRPDATSETIVDGWLRSGDLGRVDEEGFVYVEDRAKDMILRGGENIYCAEVEAVLYEHPAVHEAAVFGVPHDRLGEEVAAAVYLKRGARLDPSELQAFAGERLAPFKVPSRVDIHPSQLPRNASGKIVKRELRDQLSA